MTITSDRHFRDFAVTALILVAFLFVVAGVFVNAIQALLPIAALSMALLICIISRDRDVRLVSGALSFAFGMSTLSNFCWYLVPDYIAPFLGITDLGNWYYVTGTFWLLGYITVACVLVWMWHSRQWHLAYKIDRIISAAALIGIFLIAAFVFVNLDWQSKRLIDILELMVFLWLDVIIVTTALKMALSPRSELRYLAVSIIAFFGINSIADLLFETRWLFGLSKLITINLDRVEMSFHLRDLIDVTYNVSLVVIAGTLFMFVLDHFARRTLDEVRGRLKDTQLFVDDLVAKSPDATCIFDRDGRVVLVNDAFLQVFGLKRSDMDRSFNIFGNLGAKIFRDETYAEILKVRDSGTVIIPKLKIQRIPGGRQDEFYLYVKVFPTYSSGGEVSNYVMITEDITARIGMEMALRQSEEKFRVLAETSPAAICLFRGERFLYVNPAVERISGYSREEFASMNLWDLLTPEYRDLLQERMKSRMGGTVVPSSYELRIITRSKEPKWVSISIGPVEINNSPAFMVSAFDVTERMQAEKALRESEEKFRALTEMAPVAICILQGGRFKYANPAMEAISGYGREELRELNFMDMVHPDAREYIAGRYGLWANGESEGEVRSVLKCLRKDGNECWIDLSRNTIDYEGMSAMLLTGIDITARMRVEEALREREEQYRNLVENVGEWIWENDREGRFTYSSPKIYDLLGYRPDEVIGLRPQDLMTPENAEKTREDVKWQEAQGQYPQMMGVELLHKDGHTVFMEVSGKPVYDLQGNQTGFRGVSRDVTARKQAEEALRESEASLAKAQMMAHIGSWEWDSHSGKARWSDELFEISGLDRARIEPSYTAFVSLVHPDDRTRVYGHMGEAFADKLVFNVDFRIVRPDGSERTVHCEGEIAVDKNGAPEKMFGTCQDITDRKETELALAESESKFRVLAETSPAAIVIYQDESIMYVNPAFEATTGYKLEELLAMRPWDFIHPDYRGQIKEKVLMRKQGVPLSEHYDAKIVTRDGRELWSSNWTTTTTYKNRPAGLIIAIDITDRKRAEQALRESEASLAQAQRVAHIGSWEWDRQGDRVAWSEELYHIYGLDRQSISPSQEAFVGLVHPDDRKMLNRAIWEAISNRSSYNLDFRIVRPDGSMRTLHCDVEIGYDPKGEPVRMFGTVQDITERILLEKELRNAYDSLKAEYGRKIDFTNAAAHELRTPLTPIIGYTDILKSEVKDERHLRFLEIIERNALRQKTLVNRMLELASLDAGMAHVHRSEFALSPLVAEIADNYRAVNPNIRVEVPAEMRIDTDPDILRHVLDNLVSNAVKYSDNDKEIEIRVSETGDSYQFSVKDRGAGIPEDEWGKIFERFYIVGGETDSRSSGRSGLGLALVRAYIRLIGGNVWLDSEPGKGSTFFFTVPRKPSSGSRN